MRMVSIMKLICTKKTCKKEWDYQGSNKFYATCPDCKTSVKILKPEVEE